MNDPIRYQIFYAIAKSITLQSIISFDIIYYSILYYCVLCYISTHEWVMGKGLLQGYCVANGVLTCLSQAVTLEGSYMGQWGFKMKIMFPLHPSSMIYKFSMIFAFLLY